MKAGLKICGMLLPENIAAVAALKPDYLGFIFYKGSKRYAGDLVPDVVKALPAEIRRVGVFVNEALSTVLSIIDQYGLDAVQLHGDEDPEYCRVLSISLSRMLKSYTVIKAFGLNEEFDFNRLKAYSHVVDCFLFDTKTPDHGGSGKQFKWDLLEKYTLDVPYFLSGGIDPESVAAIQDIDDPRLIAIDINSKFELEPGLKDINKLTVFKNRLYES